MEEFRKIILEGFNKMSWSDIAGVWGAIVATILAIFQIRKEYLERHRIAISYRLTGNEHDADIISVANLGKKKILIDYYELYSKSRGLLGKTKLLYSPEDANINIAIDSNSREDFEFSDQYKISLSGNKKLYIKLSIMGRKSKMYLVC